MRLSVIYLRLTYVLYFLLDSNWTYIVPILYSESEDVTASVTRRVLPNSLIPYNHYLYL